MAICIRTAQADERAARYSLAGIIHKVSDVDVYNALCAITACSVLNIPVTAMQQGLKTVKVKGRVEPVPMPGDFTLLIDYAHNAVNMQMRRFGL